MRSSLTMAICQNDNISLRHHERQTHEYRIRRRLFMLMTVSLLLIIVIFEVPTSTSCLLATITKALLAWKNKNHNLKPNFSLRGGGSRIDSLSPEDPSATLRRLKPHGRTSSGSRSSSRSGSSSSSRPGSGSSASFRPGSGSSSTTITKPSSPYSKPQSSSSSSVSSPPLHIPGSKTTPSQQAQQQFLPPPPLEPKDPFVKSKPQQQQPRPHILPTHHHNRHNRTQSSNRTESSNPTPTNNDTIMVIPFD